MNADERRFLIAEGRSVILVAGDEAACSIVNFQEESSARQGRHALPIF